MWQVDKNGTRPAAVILAAVAMAVMAVDSAQACPPRYTIEFFDGPDCNPSFSSETAGFAINSSGMVVGTYRACALAQDKAFKWSSGPDITLLSFPLGTQYSQAFDIADDGAIVGLYALANGGGAFLRFNGAFTPLGIPDGANYANAAGVNSAHVVVGEWGNISTGLIEYAFRWVDGEFEDITPQLLPPHAGALAISESGLITGFTGNYQESPGSYAFVWDQGKATILGLPDGAYAAKGFSVADNGQVCGEAYFPFPNSPFFTKHGVVWANGTITDIGVLPGDDRSTLASINSSGLAVGFSGNYTTHIDRPILWDGQAIHVLQDLVDGLGPATLLLATRINDSGQISGFAQMAAGGWNGFRLNPIALQAGDTNCDNQTNVDDLLNVINGWGPCPIETACDPDLNHDNLVGIEDLMIVLKSWDF